MIRLIAVAATLLISAACTPADPPEAGMAESGNIQHTTNQDPYREIDTDMEDTDQNPNFPTEVNYAHMGKDRQKVLEVVNQSQFQFRGVFFLGKKATVNVIPKESYTKEELKKLEKELQGALPRYKINLKLEE